MIFVDTSVWIAALRSAPSAEARHLRALLEADLVGLPVLVRLEILTGASQRDAPKLRRSLSAFPQFTPSAETWNRIEEWVDLARKKSDRFGIADLLIAALAAEANAEIWSLDDDFRRLGRLGLVRLHVPPSH